MPWVPDGDDNRKKYVAPDMHSWAELTESVAVGGQLAVAVATGRPELVPASSGPLDAEEATRLMKLIKVLLATNQELQDHCRYLSVTTERVLDNAKGVTRSLGSLKSFANFRSPDVNENGEVD